MFLSIATTHQPATDLGFLLMKHPDRVHEVDLSFGCPLRFFRRQMRSAAKRRSSSTSIRSAWCAGAATATVALREFALGHEALARFVARAPLRKIHECVFGVLALESEPIDPRL
jgi:PNKP (polynucleotide 5'-kinase/3'-phosphatase) family adenylyltransferase-like protein/Hen1-like subunit of RNA repair complex